MKSVLPSIFLLLLPATIFAAAGSPEFNRDVLPILRNHCQACHRPGEIAPMPLITYADIRPWAKAIREAVTLRRMPPWFADPQFGHFSNDPSLSAAEIATIQSWVEAGAPAGSSPAPPARQWPSGWTTITPDIIFTMPRPFPIPAKAVIDYQYLILPTHFSIDRWVRAVEIRPSDRSVVHHAVLYVREPGSQWLRGVPPGVMWAPPASDPAAVMATRETKADILAVYTPGASATVCPPGMAKKVPAGSDLVLQFHYTSKETPRQDQTEIGLVMSSEEPQKRILTLQMGNDRFVIPPGDRDYRVRVSGTMPRDALLISMLPHMHLRGSEFEYDVIGADGHERTLLHVKPYDFYWQLSYQLAEPILLHRGDRMIWTAHFDNSANNPRNPDPAAEVRWGEQSWQEMMIGFFDVAVEPDVDKQSFFNARWQK